MFEREKIGEKATLVFFSKNDLKDSENLEFSELVVSAGADIVGGIYTQNRNPNARYFLGKGKLNELHISIRESDSDLIIFKRFVFFVFSCQVILSPVFT
mgnify:CR=1 FL=1